MTENNFVTDSAVFDYENTEWGSLHSIAEFIRDKHKVKAKVLVMEKGMHTNYKLHSYRSQIWNFLSGKGVMVIDGTKMEVKQGETVFIPCGTWYSAKSDNDNKLEILEIQFGEKTDKSDVTYKHSEWSDIEKEVK